jgi:hypothetical protein
MTRQLVLVHGRAQEQKDSIALKAEWLEALEEGLAKSNLKLPIAEQDVRFPFYGDTLYDMVGGKSADEAALIVVRGDDTEDDEKRFTRAVMEEIREKTGITSSPRPPGRRWSTAGRSTGNGSRASSGPSTGSCPTAAARASRSSPTTSINT